MKLGGHSYSYFGLSGFLLRLAAALFVVFATYNPSGFSFYHWVARRWARHQVIVLAAADPR